MNFRRTVASDVTLWLSVLTAMLSVVAGVTYFFYASHAVRSKLIAEAERTADELSRVLVEPLYNFDQSTAIGIAVTYATSGRANGIRLQADGLGEIFNNLSSVSSNLPHVIREIVKKGQVLGTMELVFSDKLVQEAQKRAVRTTLISVFLLFLLYSFSLHLILRRILAKPLNGLGSRLQEIADGSFEGRMDPVPQQDLQTIVSVANTMFEEIASHTRTLEEKERNYREIYNSTGDAIFVHDAKNGRILDVNQTMLNMYGYSSKEEFLSLSPEQFRGDPPYSNQDAEVKLQAALHDGSKVFNWRARRKDGSLFWVEVSLKKSVISDQEVILALVRDISKREQLEEQLRQAQKLEAIGTLAGGIAHDFNNILAAILGYTELARMQVTPSSQLSDDLSRIEKASLRARELVKQILTFSRKEQSSREVLCLASIVGEALSLVRSSLPATVTMTSTLESQSKIMGDASQIHQVVMNLCTNGYQSMPDATGHLFVSLADVVVDGDGKEVAPELNMGRYVVLTIEDDGKGMDNATQKKIFEPYFTTKEVGRGTGLGLAVVHGIVQNHNGTITLESQPGKGTVVKVYFAVTSTPLPVKDIEVEQVYADSEKRIMVVDDEAPIRMLMRSILTHGGYEVDTYANGLLAWQAFSANPAKWDLLLTDVSMPVMSGEKLVCRVLSLCPDMPIIFCTGYNEIDYNVAGIETDAVSYLAKPVTMEELLAAVAAVMRHHGTG